MLTPVLSPAHAPNQRLILYALGQSDAELVAHMEMCDTCRTQAEDYRSMLAATREALNPASGRVNLMSYADQCILESTECYVSDSSHTLRVALSTIKGALHGRLTVDETCTCWQDAPVRLFGPNGLVASGRVDANGDFQFPMPVIGNRYSLGLVLTRHDEPELQIIGNFDLR